MSDVIKLKKGLDIPLKGKASTEYAPENLPEQFALKPTDFFGLKPKMAKAVGDKVQAGDVLFYDKQRPEIKFVSPVSGELVAVNRGERRAILEVVVKAEGAQSPAEVGKLDVSKASREAVVSKLLETGAWVYLLQRPYNVIADPTAQPKAIFVSTFDTAPLAPDYDFVIRGNEAAFQAGIDALAKIAPVYVGNRGEGASSAFTDVKNATVTTFKGKHPAGVVGVQINHVNPINAGETVLTIKPQEVVAIGKIFSEGKHDFSRVVALTGSEVSNPRYFHTIVGAQLKSLTDGALTGDHVRIISGNVLTGTKTSAEGYLGFHDSQVSVIPEGDDYEFMGWIAPGTNKFSASRTFLSWLCCKKEYTLDTNTHGEERAIVVSGEMEKVLPMDIYPEHLFKAILAQDIDKMIDLGIYEVGEEDVALCEFVCTSKLPLQRILRNGLKLMQEEVG